MAAQRRRGLWSRLTGAFSAIITIAFIGLAAAAAFIWESTRAGPSQSERAIVVVPRGASVTTIGRMLEQEGQIRAAIVFRVASIVYARNRPLKAGEYAIPARSSPRAIIDMMAEGRVVLHPITIAEGLTSAAIINLLAESDVLSGETPPVPPEGSLLPETYNVERGMDRTALIARMRAARGEAVREIWARRSNDLPIHSVNQFITLASIVEKETGVASERPQVAAVFVNRLRRGMRIESDPTIIYGVCKLHPARCVNGRLVDERTGEQRGIRASEIALDTGYNTYRIPALPPTPIANPGRASLEAVANPARSRAIFFVADGTGGHAFAETLAQHNRNVARWRAIERGEVQTASRR
jgi:UPF0755 protein